VKWKGFSSDVCCCYRYVLVQGGGDGVNYIVFSGVVCFSYCYGLIQGGCYGGKWKWPSGDVCWLGIGWDRRREMECVQW
jgi:hypothetical protein